MAGGVAAQLEHSSTRPALAHDSPCLAAEQRRLITASAAMTAASFDAWLESGIRAGFVVDQFCAMHDGLPLIGDEVDAFENGEDPCITALRVRLPEQPSAVSPWRAAQAVDAVPLTADARVDFAAGARASAAALTAFVADDVPSADAVLELLSLGEMRGAVWCLLGLARAVHERLRDEHGDAAALEALRRWAVDVQVRLEP
jgi:hypothetical protein